MAYYTSEVISKVKQIDLLSYLKNCEPEELVKFSKDTFVTKSHDSLKINNGMWYWFSKGIGGKSALDYLVKVKDYSFTNAIEKLLNNIDCCPIAQYTQEQKVEKKEFFLPKKSDTNRVIIKYLMKRGIDESIIKECIDNDLIYEDLPNHNVVFLGYDINQKPRYAMCRGTNDSRFMKEVGGSHKAFSFRLFSKNECNEVHLFESAIDLLSYATLMKINGKDWSNSNLLSLAGVYQPSKNLEESKIPLALNYFLNLHPNIKKIYLHLDNDIAGRTATKALQTVLPNQYEVIDCPPPKGKDVNDFLLYYQKIKQKNYERER